MSKMKEDNLVMVAEFAKDRKLCPLSIKKCFAARDKDIYNNVCSCAFESCRNFSEGNPISKEEHESGNYAVQALKDGKIVAFLGEVAT